MMKGRQRGRHVCVCVCVCVQQAQHTVRKQRSDRAGGGREGGMFTQRSTIKRGAKTNLKTLAIHLKAEFITSQKFIVSLSPLFH